MPERHLEAITAKILDQIERRVELENLFPTPPMQSFSIKNFPKQINHIDEVEKLADKILNQWALTLSLI